MSEAAFVFPLLRALEEGRNLRTLAKVVLRVEAVLTGLAGIFGLFEIFRLGSREHMPSALSFPLITSTILLLVHLLVVVQVFWFRSGKVEEIADSPFPALPIVAQLVRCFGEYLACSAVFAGLAATIFIWSLGGQVPREISIPLVANPFVLGLLVLHLGALLAFSFLVFSYLMADQLVATEDRNRCLHLMAFGGGAAFSSSPAPACPVCQQEVITGSAFCDHCGQSLAT
jgi:hypothetical protein